MHALGNKGDLFRRNAEQYAEPDTVGQITSGGVRVVLILFYSRMSFKVN
jgi:hypothetical protein